VHGLGAQRGLFASAIEPDCEGTLWRRAERSGGGRWCGRPRVDGDDPSGGAGAQAFAMSARFNCGDVVPSCGLASMVSSWPDQRLSYLAAMV
jgi:hypothetical protein